VFLCKKEIKHRQYSSSCNTEREENYFIKHTASPFIVVAIHIQSEACFFKTVISDSESVTVKIIPGFACSGKVISIPAHASLLASLLMEQFYNY